MIDKRTIVAATGDRVRTDTASILEKPEGELLITYHSYSEGEDGSGDFGSARIYLQKSIDMGRTWTNERLIADIDEGDLNVMSPYLCAWKDEIILGFCRNHSKGDTTMELLRSSDGGESFHGSEYIWNHCDEYRLQGGASSMVALADGRILFPYQSVPEVWVSDENEYVGSYVSDDGGHTWTASKNTLYLPLRGAMEPSAAQLSNGDIIMSLRTQLGSVFFTRSTDRGETWSRPQTAGLRSPESCTCLRRIPDTEDWLVLFWNDSEYIGDHHHYGIRSPLSAAVSRDGGANWRKLGDIETADEMYTNLGCTFLSNGEAILTYLAGPDYEIVNGVYAGPVTDPELDRDKRKFELREAIIEREWFFQD